MTQNTEPGSSSAAFGDRGVGVTSRGGGLHEPAGNGAAVTSTLSRKYFNAATTRAVAGELAGEPLPMPAGEVVQL